MASACFRCQKELSFSAQQKISRKEECPHCAQDLHCCKMCIHYDNKVYNECKESNADRVVEKDKANFCDYFSLGAGQSSYDKVKTDTLKALDNLFKK